MGAKYIYRIDDIVPEMNWDNFWRLISLFQAYGVKPLLGVVPDNRDSELVVEEKNNRFWQVISDLQQKGLVEIAQHGYEHRLIPTESETILGRKYGFNSLSEFAGLPWKIQREMIRNGREIMEQNGVSTDIWMAPNHSFDWATLKALQDLGFGAITDGIGLYPFFWQSIVFIPQQIWRPRYFPFGLLTICLHPNNIDDKLWRQINAHLESGAKIISFSEARKLAPGPLAPLFNQIFKLGYRFFRTARTVWEEVGKRGKGMKKQEKTVFLVMLFSLLSKLLGFTREIVLASSFGATETTDAYVLAVTITLIVFSSLGVALSTTFIPLYAEVGEKIGKEKSERFANNVLNLVLVFTTGLSLLGLVFIAPLVKLFASGLKSETLSLTTQFTKLLLPGVIIIGINYVLTGYLQSNKKSQLPVLTGLPYNLLIISAIVLASPGRNGKILIYGTLLGLLSQFLLQFYFAWRTGHSFRWELDFKDGNLKRLGFLVLPVFGGMGVKQLNLLIDRGLASRLSPGSISALNFADRLNSFVYDVFVSSLSAVMYPLLAHCQAKNDQDAFNEQLVKFINLMLILIIPISVGALCLSGPIVKLLFERGAFDWQATQKTTTALFYYSLGMIGFALRDVLSQAFFSLQNTRIPMLTGVIAVIINIILNLILIRPLGHGGLALATSISSLVGAALLFYRLKSVIGSFGEREVLIAAVKVGLASTLMGFIIKLIYSPLALALAQGFIGQGLALFSTILLGGLLYFILITAMGVREIRFLLELVKRNFVAKGLNR